MKVWTLAEANAELPRITDVVLRARQAVEDIRAHAATVAEAAGGNGHARKGDEAEVFNAVIEELAGEGIVLRDVDRGLVDFPARSASGRSYWLCWIVGEPEVGWWHWPEDGFAGRTPIDQPPG